VAVSFIGGGNRRKQPTCGKSLTNIIIWCSIVYTSPWAGFELTTLVVIGINFTCSCKSNYHTIRQRRPTMSGIVISHDPIRGHVQVTF